MAITKKSELINIFDADGNPRGVASRSEVHQQGLWHRSFHCWIVFLSNDAEKYVVFQHRGPFKRDWPDYLDISGAGHYVAGEEGLEGGIRELNEELGLKVEPGQLWKIGVRKIDEHLDNGTINREFQDVYFLRSHYSLSDYNLNFPEVAGVFHLRVGDVQNLLSTPCDSIIGQGIMIDPDSGNPVATQKRFSQQDFIPNALDYLRLVMNLADSFLENDPQNLSSFYGAVETDRVITLPDGSYWQPEHKNR
jgi:isopentenyldiphosphate isomerase